MTKQLAPSHLGPPLGSVAACRGRSRPSVGQQSSEPMWRKPMTPSAWVGLGLASLSLLVLALVVPKGLGAALTLTGLAALGVFRVAAMTGRWTPRRLTGHGRRNHAP